MATRPMSFETFPLELSGNTAFEEDVSLDDIKICIDYLHPKHSDTYHRYVLFRRLYRSMRNHPLEGFPARFYKMFKYDQRWSVVSACKIYLERIEKEN